MHDKDDTLARVVMPLAGPTPAEGFDLRAAASNVLDLHVDMDAHLRRPRLGDALKGKAGLRVSARPDRGPIRSVVLGRERTLQQLSPEPCQTLRFGAVDGDARPAVRHGASVSFVRRRCALGAQLGGRAVQRPVGRSGPPAATRAAVRPPSDRWPIGKCDRSEVGHELGPEGVEDVRRTWLAGYRIYPRWLGIGSANLGRERIGP